MSLGDWVDRLAVWDGFHPDLQTLLIYGAGIAVYTALVFTFYANISRRDPLHSNAGRGWWAKALHVSETALTFPLLSFGYFTVLALALFLMAKPDRATADILLLSMAAVLGVRVTAHLSEQMSNDVAKLLPLSLLAVVLVDPGYLSIAGSLARVAEAAWMAPVLAQYFVLFILVEATLRGVRKLAPTFSRVARKVDHHRHLSKRALLRDIDREHVHHGLRASHHHDHAPRDRSHDFLALEESMARKPGARTHMGPAIEAEQPPARAAPAPAYVPMTAPRGPAPRAGPGGSRGEPSESFRSLIGS